MESVAIERLKLWQKESNEEVGKIIGFGSCIFIRKTDLNSMLKKSILFGLCLSLVSLCSYQHPVIIKSWKELSTVKDLWDSHPEKIRNVIGALDQSYFTLGEVIRQLEKGDTVAAASNLLGVFKNAERQWVLTTLEDFTPESNTEIAVLLQDGVVRINDQEAHIPLISDGGWMWDFTGPVGDDEFGYSLNAHGYLASLYFQYKTTSNVEFVKTFDQIMKDWTIHHSLPEKDDSIYIVLESPSKLDYRDIGEVEWRTLDAGRRLGDVWPQLFYGFQDSYEFSDATKLLMLSSMIDQAGYLRRYHKRGHNWTTMEMNGLALTGLAFPEFKDSGNWADYALEVMTDEIERQVYPDGIQTELAGKTQWVALHRFESVSDNFYKTGRDVGDMYRKKLEDMYNYLAYSMRPDGHQPLNSDSDREDLRPRVLAAADKYGREDWKFIATNGVEGLIPEDGPSVTFPWAGIVIMRSGWHSEAYWSFFDAGPYGTGHQHRDKLHLSISAYGKDLLVDGGRFTHQNYFSFDPAEWRGYFRSSFSHNTILVNGNGQRAYAERAKSPLIEGVDYLHDESYDYAEGTFDAGYEKTEGKVQHRRAVFYLHNEFWIVLDQVLTDRPRHIEVLWHFAPDCQVVLPEKGAKTENGDFANLTIVPLGTIEWERNVISGQETPSIQGWYSKDYGKKEVSSVALFKNNLKNNASFGWLLLPSKGTANELKVTSTWKNNAVIVNVEHGDGTLKVITLPLDGQTDRISVRVKLK